MQSPVRVLYKHKYRLRQHIHQHTQYIYGWHTDKEFKHGTWMMHLSCIHQTHTGYSIQYAPDSLHTPHLPTVASRFHCPSWWISKKRRRRTWSVGCAAGRTPSSAEPPSWSFRYVGSGRVPPPLSGILSAEIVLGKHTTNRMRLRMYVYVCIYVCLFISVYMFIYMHVSECICVRVFMYTRACMACSLFGDKFATLCTTF